MNVRLVPILVWLGLLAVSAEAGLPNSFSGWQMTSFRPVAAGQLAQYAGEDTALLEEYGFVVGERREYVRGDDRLTVSLWQMRDTTGSYGLYTFYRDPEMETSEEQDRISLGAARLVMQRGLHVVEARGARLDAEEARMLLTGVASLAKFQDLPPPLPQYLPQENFVAGSIKYVMGEAALDRLSTNLPGSAIGFELGAEAVLAQYRVQGRPVRMLLVSYATPQLAAKRLEIFRQLPVVSAAGDEPQFFVERKGSLLCFVLDLPAQSAAQQLFEQVRYQSVVTWNEYAPTHRDNPGDLVLNAFLLAGLLLLFATVAGISFGGVRIFTKKFIRVPIFDRPSQVEIIRLRLFDE
ncbi:MAG: hypothetical protein HY649_00250 [Acidobacteria bacterium]|nr:hypothetical protein [Acidobacteriota bacterium]